MSTYDLAFREPQKHSATRYNEKSHGLSVSHEYAPGLDLDTCEDAWPALRCPLRKLFPRRTKSITSATVTVFPTYSTF